MIKGLIKKMKKEMKILMNLNINITLDLKNLEVLKYKLMREILRVLDKKMIKEKIRES